MSGVDDGDSERLRTLLAQAGSGDRSSLDALLPLVYERLHQIASRQLAGDARRLTLSPTVLVHEAWLGLLGARSANWTDQAHFYRYAATAMRRIIIDHARARQADKRGGGAALLDLDGIPVGAESDASSLVALDEALLRLEAIDPRLIRVVELRFFAGLPVEDVARVLGVHVRSVVRDWRKARALLHGMLDPEPG
jgi:RNA polymerase sigma factor (TIGR02999 family)